MENDMLGLRDPIRARTAGEAEVEWYFSRASGRVPAPDEVDPDVHVAAKEIRARLDRLKTYQVGALELRFDRRPWPPLVTAELGEWASLVVRLETAQYSSDVFRDVAGLETEAALRLERGIADVTDEGATRRRLELVEHAHSHVRGAMRAYTALRSRARCVLPAGVWVAS